MLTSLVRLAKGALFDAKGTLSLSRCVLLFVVLEVTAITWLAVAWVWYVTRHGLMAEAAPLASAVSQGLAAVLSAQVVGAAFQYFTQAKWSSGGIAGRQLDVEAERASILEDMAAGVEHEPIVVPVVSPEVVPDDRTEPRVAAEQPGPDEMPDAGSFTTADPFPVVIVDDKEEDSR